MGPQRTQEPGRLRALAEALRQFLYGMTTYEMVRTIERARAEADNRLAILVIGGMLGAPLPANYYSLRLFPHLLPYLEGQRRRLWRERDLIDLADDVSC